MDQAELTAFIAALPTKRMAAGVLLRDRAGRVLIVEPTYKDHWEIPGGVIERDESPLAAARRELDEELGLTRSPGRLLAVDWVPPRTTHTEGVMLIFDGGVLGPDEISFLRVPPEELRGFAFCTPEECARLLSPLLARRVAAALAALTALTVAYLENGVAP